MSGAGAHLPLLAALTTAAGVGMSRLGMGLGLLKQRHPRRRCPSCGRLPGRRGCERCAP